MYHGNGMVQRAFDNLPVMRKVNDSAIASGMAFLVGELEKRDEKLYEPLTSVTWMRDIVADTGGGWSEYTSNYFVDYATTGNQTSGIIGGQTTDIPVIQANLTKDNYKVFTWSNILRIPFVDQQMLNTVSRSLDDILDKGIKLAWNKDLDTMTYEGYESLDVYGIVNNPNVNAEMAANGAAGTATWRTKTPDEILDDINSVILETWEASEYDLTGMANHILIDPSNYAYITTRKVSEAGNVSILQYILENNIAKNQDRDLMIFPCRWCTGTGSGSTNRMVAYVNEKDKIRIDIPVMIGRVMTQPNVQDLAYLTAYVGQIGQVKIMYYETVRYKDGI